MMRLSDESSSGGLHAAVSETIDLPLLINTLFRHLSVPESVTLVALCDRMDDRGYTALGCAVEAYDREPSGAASLAIALLIACGSTFLFQDARQEKSPVLAEHQKHLRALIFYLSFEISPGGYENIVLTLSALPEVERIRASDIPRRKTFQKIIPDKNFFPLGCDFLEADRITSDLFIEYAHHSFITKLIERSIDSLRRNDPLFLAFLLEKNKIDIISVAQWFIICVKFKNEMGSLKFGKTAIDIAFEYFLSSCDDVKASFSGAISVLSKIDIFKEIAGDPRIQKFTNHGELLASNCMREIKKISAQNFGLSDEREVNRFFESVDRIDLDLFIGIIYQYLTDRDGALKALCVARNSESYTALGVVLKKLKMDQSESNGLKLQLIAMLLVGCGSIFILHNMQLFFSDGREFIMAREKVLSGHDQFDKVIQFLSDERRGEFFQILMENSQFYCNESIIAIAIRDYFRKKNGLRKGVISKFHVLDIAQWYMACLKFQGSIKKSLSGKAPFEVLRDWYLMADESVRSEWTAQLKVLLNDLKCDLTSSLDTIRCFTHPGEAVKKAEEACDQLLKEEAAALEKKEKKKKKKPKAEVTAKEIPVVKPDPEEGGADQCAKKEIILTPSVQKEWVPVQRPPVEKRVTPKKIKPPTAKSLPKEQVEFSETEVFRLIDSIGSTEGRLEKCVVFYTLSILFKRKFSDFENPKKFNDSVKEEALLNFPKSETDRYFVTTDAFSKEPSYFWNLAIQTFVLGLEGYSRKPASSIANKAITLIDLDLRNLEFVREKIRIFLEFIRERLTSFSLLIGGSRAQRMVQNAFRSEGRMDEEGCSSDIDLYLVVNLDSDEFDLFFNAIRYRFPLIPTVKLLFEKKYSVESGKICLASIRFEFNGFPVDVSFFCDSDCVLRLPRMDSARSAFINIQDGSVVMTRYDLALSLQGARHFKKEAFQDPTCLAYVFRELSKMMHQGASSEALTPSCESDLKAFMEDEKNDAVIRKAIGLFITKYTLGMESIHFYFLETKGWLGYVRSSFEVDDLLIKTVVHLSLDRLQKAAEQRELNFFPAIYLTMHYLLGPVSLEEESRVHLSYFPMTVQKQVGLLLSAWHCHSNRSFHPESMADFFCQTLTRRHATGLFKPPQIPVQAQPPVVCLAPPLF